MYDAKPFQAAPSRHCQDRLNDTSNEQIVLDHHQQQHLDKSPPVSWCSFSSHIHESSRAFTPIRMSSIDHGHESEPADALAEQIALDGSAGSDTDITGRPRSDSLAKDESEYQHHARSNSVKKPTTFKAVSVTKNFLAKAGTPAAPAAKTNGEEGIATLL